MKFLGAPSVGEVDPNVAVNLDPEVPLEQLRLIELHGFFYLVVCVPEKMWNSLVGVLP